MAIAAGIGLVAHLLAVSSLNVLSVLHANVNFAEIYFKGLHKSLEISNLMYYINKFMSYTR